MPGPVNALSATPSAQPPSPAQPGPGLRRRQWLAQAGLWAAALPAAWPGAAQALPARALQFPRDHGSHPGLRTEWWYITGQAWSAGGRRWGFQVTFFRSRVDGTQSLQSAFAARQLLFAHAALTDLQGGRLLHDERIARAGFGIAEAAEHDTDIRLQDWTLRRTDLALPGGARGSRYTAHLEGSQLGLQLTCDSTQPLLLQGQQGLSRKGPDAVQASYYYSQPQLAVRGSLAVQGQRFDIDPAAGPCRAWMDHEWSEALLHPEAVGWDWIGMNLQDGSALTAFRLRRADGSALWAGGSWRSAAGALRIFAAPEVRFEPLRHWTSPHSGARYPVAWRVHTPAGRWEVRSLLDAQELDSTASTGAIYWEGLSTLHDEGGSAVGQGYLEMTGYARALRL
ncbi:carotenoid 1,2-hydratase [Acidovorax lacteus]|uniref:Lipocalin-like domain-containing protein n=1 Tax=Acidovorax lacteus TaxID=1924988 RepID=A0ABP8LH40_9BURK